MSASRCSGGVTTLQNTGSEPAVIDHITVASKIHGLVGRIRVDTPQANVIYGAARGFPPPLAAGERLPMRRPEGARVIHGHDLHVLVELIPPQNGNFTAGPITVVYHVGEHRYRRVVPSYGTACAPRNRRCQVPTPQEVQ